jgi:hypothetical protein
MTTPVVLEKTSPAVVKARRPRTVGGATLGQDSSRDAKRLAAVLLEVLAGARTPTQAAAALGVSLPRYYHLEARGLRGLLAGCEARPRGRGHRLETELANLRRARDRLERDLARQQALVRLAQRAVGLPPPAPVPAKAAGKKRRRPAARALSIAERLQPAGAAPETATAAGVPGAGQRPT